MAEHDFSYCLNIADDNGYIGSCEKCIYYRNSGTSFKKTEENIRNDLQIQLATLKDIVHEYRMHEKNKEDIEQAFKASKRRVFVQTIQDGTDAAGKHGKR